MNLYWLPGALRSSQSSQISPLFHTRQLGSTRLIIGRQMGNLKLVRVMVQIDASVGLRADSTLVPSIISILIIFNTI